MNNDNTSNYDDNDTDDYHNSDNDDDTKINISIIIKLIIKGEEEHDKYSDGSW